MDDTTTSECGEVARKVLRSALSELSRPTAEQPLQGKALGIDFGKRWIGALHDGFRSVYSDESRYSVFSRARPSSGPASSWKRQEYLFDVVVAEAERRNAPIHQTAKVAVITGSRWQVESEVSLNAAHVAEDLGKLVLGSAASKLLIAAIPADPQNLGAWLAFIEKAAEPVCGNFFLALIPTYSTKAVAHEGYLAQAASILFYERRDGRLVEDPAPLVSLPTELIGMEQS